MVAHDQPALAESDFDYTPPVGIPQQLVIGIAPIKPQR